MHKRLLGYWHQRGFSSRTHPALFDFGKKSLGLWPRSGLIESDGAQYELPMLVHRTAGKGSSSSESKLLPTPSATLGNDSEGTETWLARQAAMKVKYRNNGLGMPLAIAVKLLPTPTDDDANNVTRTSGGYLSVTRTVQTLSGSSTPQPSNTGNP